MSFELAAGWSGCVYCGLPTRRPPACIAHRDLLELDPLYDPGDSLVSVQLQEVSNMPEVDAGGSVIEYLPDDGAYACPECGRRYDTPGVCTGHDEAGHPAASVEAVGGAGGGESKAALDEAREGARTRALEQSDQRTRSPRRSPSTRAPARPA